MTTRQEKMDHARSIMEDMFTEHSTKSPYYEWFSNHTDSVVDCNCMIGNVYRQARDYVHNLAYGIVR